MFLLLAGLIAAASAACPDVDGLISDARDAFADAEVAQARQTLDRAYEALGCQQATVPRETLLSLYHLDALASIADEDGKASLFAVIRAVSVDPDAPPPAEFGPELQGQHSTWAGRLREDQVRVVVTDDATTVWIDGVAVDGSVDVVTGEHVVQARGAEGWTSRVMDLSVGGRTRGLPLELQAPPAPPEGPTPPDSEVRPPLPPPAPEPRRIRGGVVATGVLLGLAGGGAILGGRVLESRFDADPYDADVYGDCTRSQSCWSDARSSKIAADARRANALYLTGYVAVGVGVGVLGLELFVLQSGESRGLGVRGRL